MPERKNYVATQDFCLNMDNGAKTHNVKKGEVLEFDGLYASYRGEEGQARNLIKVIGDWLEETTAECTKAHDELGTTKTGPSRPSRQATAGQIVEQSSIDHDLEEQTYITQDRSSHEELKDLVAQSERSIETKVTDDLEDARREVKVINQDADVVAQVSKEAKTNAPVTNTAGVEGAQEEPTKASVITEQEQVVKETNYQKKEASFPEHEKLTVDKEAMPNEVKKVEEPAIHPGTDHAATIQPHTKEVSKEEDVVKSTSYERSEPTDVGSSTQTNTTPTKKSKASAKKSSSKSSKKKSSSNKKSSAKKSKPKTSSKTSSKAAPKPQESAKPAAPESQESGGPSSSSTEKKGPTIISDTQEATVVGKVSETKGSDIETSDGITVKTKVGSGGDMDIGDVEFSANNQVNKGEAKTSKGTDTAQDISEMDIDVDDLLKDA
jgi:hypothetical protein